jgi:hypothetical protein
MLTAPGGPFPFGLGWQADAAPFTKNGPNRSWLVFNETDSKVTWLIIGTPEELGILHGANAKPYMPLIYPTDPTQLPEELTSVQWPPRD